VVFLSGQANSRQSRKRSAETDNSLTIANTASSSNRRPGSSDLRAQYHSNKKRQHSGDAAVLTRTPSTDGSRIQAAPVSSGTQQDEVAGTVHDTESNCAPEDVPISTRRSKDAGTVRDTESNAVEAAPSSTRHSKDAGTVHDTESSCAAEAEPSGTAHSKDAGTVHDTESSFAAEAEPSGTAHSKDAGTVHDTESSFAAEAEPSGTAHSKDAGTVHYTESSYAANAVQSSTPHSMDAGSMHDTGNSHVAVNNTQCSRPAETASTLTHTVSAAKHAAVRMQNCAELHDEPAGHLDNSMHSSDTNGDFG